MFLVIFVFVVFVPVWLAGYFSIGWSAFYLVSDLIGYAPIAQGVSGTGSMYPTFPKGDGKTDKEKANQIIQWYEKTTRKSSENRQNNRRT